MTQKWTISGDYVEACNCDVMCQCIAMEPPDDGVCTASLLFHVQDGYYGDIDLGGLNAAMLVRTEEDVMFAPDTGWDVVLLVDEAADDDQRAALEDIYLGRAGGIFGAAADAHVESAEVATAPFTFSRDETDFSVEIGDIVSVEAVGKHGFNGELGTVSPHPLTASHEMNTGQSTTATVSYDEAFTWDVSGNNSFLGDFELANA
ncbi:DUF1326 domain-containing protein [Natrinema gelatinilyticum]|uniref:DUF1326 domain-containing protein n=1 Tax=Natrinema gelatinilyticum TaxID=2961571 RepID=UPI0020C5A3CC|nr:DUF1326 domain-containing protein [Natrinema gelatinilyticum]